MSDLLMRFMARGQQEVTAALDDVEGGLTDVDAAAAKVDESTRKAESSFGRLGETAKAVGGILVASKIFAMGNEAFRASTQVTLLADKADTVFGPSVDRVDTAVAGLNERLGMSQQRLRGVVAGFGDLLVPMGFTRERAADLSSTSLEVAAALSEWSGGVRTVEESLGAISAGLTGQREQLKGYGIQISEADIAARLASKGVQDLTGDLLLQERAMATLELVMERSSDAQARFAEGGNPALLAQQRLQAATDELKQSLGEGLTPALTIATDVMGGMASAAGMLPAPVLAGGLALGGLVATLPALNSVKNAVEGLGLSARGLGTFLTGPWGIAVAGAATAVGLLWHAQQEANDRLDRANSLIDTNTGALTRNAAQARATQLQTNGMAGQADAFGVSLGLLTAASMNNAGAMAQLEQQAIANAEAYRDEILASDNLRDADRDRAHGAVENAHIFIAAVRDEADAVDQATQAQLAAIEAGNEYSDVTHRATGSVDGFARAADTAAAAAAASQSAHDGWITTLDRLRGQEDTTRSAIDMTTEAMNRRLETARAAVDPVFAASRAQRDLTTAQQRLAEVQGDGKSSADDVAKAQEDVATAALDLEGALVDLNSAFQEGETGGRELREELGRQVEEGRLAEEVYDALIGRLNTLERAARDASNAIAGVIPSSPHQLPTAANAALAGAGIVTPPSTATATSDRSAFQSGGVDNSTHVTIAAPITFGARTVAAGDPEVEELARALAEEIDRQRARS